MRVAMIGTGYVGLVSGACIADFGHQVTCVDKDSAKISALNAGEIPIYEPGLGDIVRSNVRAGTAVVHDGAERSGQRGRRGVHRGRYAVAPRRRSCRSCPTSMRRPARSPRRSTGSPSSSPSRRSRSAPATRSSGSFAKLGPMPIVAVVSNPEFLREGAAIHDFKHPDRIVVGADDERAKAVDGRDLPAALSQPGADPLHRPPDRRAHQVRSQCVPRDQDHLHQRNRRSVRARRRRRAGSGARHRARQSDRVEIPARRTRLRRLVLSQRRARSDQDRPGSRRADAHPRGGRDRQRHPKARHGAQGLVGLRRACCAARRSRSWA